MQVQVLHTGQASAQRLERRLSKLLEPWDSSQANVYIRWGTGGGPDPAGTVLNRREAVQRATDRDRVLSLLNRFGVRTPARLWDSEAPRRMAAVRQYRIPVFDHAVLACFRSEDRRVWLNRRLTRLRDDYVEVPEDADRESMRACRLALRASHALGLDFALVSIGVSPKNRLYVLDVSPTPVLHGRLLDLFSEAVSRYVARGKDNTSKSAALVLGADLEFMLQGQSGRLVLASRYFPRKGEVGCDDRTFRGDPGRLPLAEIRPAASSSPLRLVGHIREALLEAARLCPSRKIKWVAGSMPVPGFPIGGHIHFTGIHAGSRLVRALDTYVGLPVALMEDPETARIRRQKYGFLGDIRHKSHGGFEYRTPGSWLVSPEIATAVLCLAHIAAEHYRDLDDWPFGDPEVQIAFYRSDRSVLKPVFEAIWKRLTRIPLYEVYEDHLSVIPWMIGRDLTWDESADIRETWDIPAPRRRARTARSGSGAGTAAARR
ncbi:MAG: hypothetical protein QJR06_01765 [Alicyclobacillaceae bacterium]|nr:hypothetical protein [Alicyclobacillaceae bacterium]